MPLQQIGLPLIRVLQESVENALRLDDTPFKGRQLKVSFPPAFVAAIRVAVISFCRRLMFLRLQVLPKRQNIPQSRGGRGGRGGRFRGGRGPPAGGRFRGGFRGGRGGGGGFRGGGRGRGNYYNSYY